MYHIAKISVSPPDMAMVAQKKGTGVVMVLGVLS